ncbi:hypothetical protein BGZ76_011244 [Entomortierella beljakovae]|nr:hypothetical protein BGZ76_011244 [Entomortierella beljakovae]
MRYTTLLGALALIAMTTVRAQEAAAVNPDVAVDASVDPNAVVPPVEAISAEGVKAVDPSSYPSLSEIESRIKIFNAYAVKNTPKEKVEEKGESKESAPEKSSSSQSKKGEKKKSPKKSDSKKGSSKKHHAKVQHHPHAHKESKLSAENVHKGHKGQKERHPHAASEHKKNKSSKKEQKKNFQAQCSGGDHDGDDCHDCIVYETIHIVPTCPPVPDELCPEDDTSEAVNLWPGDMDSDEESDYFQQHERLQFLRRG